MKDKYEKLNEVFDVSGEIVSKETSINNGEKLDSANVNDNSKNFIEDVKKDYEYTRGNLYSLIEKGQEAINGILELAQESEMPRAYEVAGQLIKNVSDATDKLMDLQKKLKDLDDSGKTKGPTNVTNALFVGSTAELSKLLKGSKVKGEE